MVTRIKTPADLVQARLGQGGQAIGGLKFNALMALIKRVLNAGGDECLSKGLADQETSAKLAIARHNSQLSQLQLARRGASF